MLKRIDARYVIVSPVKDEQAHIRQTLDSVTRQTIKPVRWIIVDDGSRDRTSDIVAEYASCFPWITLIHTSGGQRQPGSAVIRAFNYGVQSLDTSDFDFIVKLDCDLRLPAHYFEKLLSRFADDPQLGIASGVYQELRSGKMKLVSMPDYHAAGASKVLRSACYHDIGGFVCERGWDTLDEIRAHTSGWRTRHFDDLIIDHLKPEGTGIGLLRTNIMHGEIFYKTGGSSFFFFCKTAARLFRGTPPLLGGVAMLYGFLAALLTRKPKLVSDTEARHYRSLLCRRLYSTMRNRLEFLSAAMTRPFWRPS